MFAVELIAAEPDQGLHHRMPAGNSGIPSCSRSCSAAHSGTRAEPPNAVRAASRRRPGHARPAEAPATWLAALDHAIAVLATPPSPRWPRGSRAWTSAWAPPTLAEQMIFKATSAWRPRWCRWSVYFQLSSRARPIPPAPTTCSRYGRATIRTPCTFGDRPQGRSNRSRRAFSSGHGHQQSRARTLPSPTSEALSPEAAAPSDLLSPRSARARLQGHGGGDGAAPAGDPEPRRWAAVRAEAAKRAGFGSLPGPPGRGRRWSSRRSMSGCCRTATASGSGWATRWTAARRSLTVWRGFHVHRRRSPPHPGALGRSSACTSAAAA